MGDNLEYVDQLYFCRGCEKDLPRREFHEWRGNRPQPRCRRCRSRARKLRLYGTLCQACGEPARLDSNSQCRSCNEARGLRQCRKCGDLLAVALDFYGRKSTCRRCLNGAPRSGKKFDGQQLSSTG